MTQYPLFQLQLREGLLLCCKPLGFRFNTNVNHNLSAHALFRYSNRWFTLRCEVLGVICVLVTAAACVVFKDKTSPAVAGIVLANMFQASGFLPYPTRYTQGDILQLLILK